MRLVRTDSQSLTARVPSSHAQPSPAAHAASPQAAAGRPPLDLAVNSTLLKRDRSAGAQGTGERRRSVGWRATKACHQQRCPPVDSTRSKLCGAARSVAAAQAQKHAPLPLGRARLKSIWRGRVWGGGGHISVCWEQQHQRLAHPASTQCAPLAAARPGNTPCTLDCTDAPQAPWMAPEHPTQTHPGLHQTRPVRPHPASPWR